MKAKISYKEFTPIIVSLTFENRLEIELLKETLGHEAHSGELYNLLKMLLEETK